MWNPEGTDFENLALGFLTAFICFYRETFLNLIKNHIKNSTELTWANRISIARDISAGMEYLHNSNIIHRDLNSNNCLVKEVVY